MRVPEKTIELNFCAELTALWAKKRQGVLWFGPTQKQEARLGFDAATRLGGSVFLFQFKASCHLLRSGERRFHAPHQQMCRLQTFCQGSSRAVFYVFPTFGTSAELLRAPSVLHNSLLLDVKDLPSPIPRPTKRSGGLRVTGNHLVDVDQGKLRATIHSDPFMVPLVTPFALLDQETTGMEGMPAWILNEYQKIFSNWNSGLGWKLKCAVVYPMRNL